MKRMVYIQFSITACNDAALVKLLRDTVDAMSPLDENEHLRKTSYSRHETYGNVCVVTERRNNVPYGFDDDVNFQ